jgi:hypothetical protein
VGKVQGVRAKRRKSQHKPLATLKDAPRERTGNGHFQTATNSEANTKSSHASSQGQNIPPHSSLNQALQEWSPEPWATAIWDETMIGLAAPSAVFNDANEDFCTISPNGSAQLINGTTVSVDISNETAPCDISHFVDGTANDSSITDGSVAEPDRNTLCNLQITTLSFSNTTNPPQGFTRVDSTQGHHIEPPSTSSLVGGPAGRLTGSACLDEAGCTAKLDSTCVLACTSIIITLENYLLFELRVLDLILSTVRSAADEVHKIAQHQQESRCDRCMFLFTTILSQLVTLLEVAFKVMIEEEPLNHTELLPNRSLNIVPRFSFGAFTIDADEQSSWKTYIVRRECQHLGQVLGKIMALAMLGPKGSAPATPTPYKERSNWFKGIEQRLKALCESTNDYTT